MRIVFHHTKFYDFEPVPPDVKVTAEDVKAGRVKPTRHGGWLMRVTKAMPEGKTTHTEVLISEEQVIAKIIHQRLRPDGGAMLSRKEAVAHYLTENSLPHHANRKWITKFEVHDDGGHDEQLARTMLGEHVKAKNLEPGELEEHIAAYIEPTKAHDHIEHLHSHFKVKA